MTTLNLTTETCTILGWDWNMTISILAITISIITLITSLYKNSKLSTTLNTLVILGLNERWRSRISCEIIAEKDLFSEQPSDFMQTAMLHFPMLSQARKTKNSEEAIKLIDQYFIYLKQQNIPHSYELENTDFVGYIGHPHFPLNFYLPLNISNTGKKSGEVSSLFLKIAKRETTKTWYFLCMDELDHDSFFENIKNQVPIMDLSKRVFPGIIIPPNSSQRFDFLTINVNEIFSELTTDLVDLGIYDLQIIGYNSKNEKCLVSNIVDLHFDEELFRTIFQGGNSIRMLTFKSHLKTELAPN